MSFLEVKMEHIIKGITTVDLKIKACNSRLSFLVFILFQSGKQPIMNKQSSACFTNLTFTLSELCGNYF